MEVDKEIIVQDDYEFHCYFVEITNVLEWKCLYTTFELKILYNIYKF